MRNLLYPILLITCFISYASIPDIINTLHLKPHIEGGYFKRLYTSSLSITLKDKRIRPLASSIYYLLSKDSPIGHFHINRSDIMHYHLKGGSLTYLVISADGKLTTHILGSNIQNGEKPFLLVKGGQWKASHLNNGDYALISEVVAPGFDYADESLVSKTQFKKTFPELYPKMKQYITTTSKHKI